MDVTKREKEALAQWISPRYLEKKTQTRLKRAFVEESFALLDAIQREEVHEKLQKELKASKEKAKWDRNGPPNKQLFLTSQDQEAMPVAMALKQIMQSDLFFGLIKKITNLEISKGSGALRCFDNGHYTLLHDEDPDADKESLDCTLCVLPLEEIPTEDGLWDEDWGGFVCYCDSDRVIENVLPDSNSLCLLYRLEGVRSFVKMPTHHAPCSRFDLSFVFREEDSPSSSSSSSLRD